MSPLLLIIFATVLLGKESIPGIANGVPINRVSPTTLTQILDEASRDSGHGLTEQSTRDGMVISSVLRSFRAAYCGFGGNPLTDEERGFTQSFCSGMKILQARLGKIMRPTTPDDLAQELEFANDIRAKLPHFGSAARRNAFWRGLAGLPTSGDGSSRYDLDFLSSLSRTVDIDIDDCRSRAASLDATANAIKNVESALDHRELQRALAGQEQLRSSEGINGMPFLQEYLRMTAATLTDLQAYADIKHNVDAYASSAPSSLIERFYQANRLSTVYAGRVTTVALLQKDMQGSSLLLGQFLKQSKDALAKDKFDEVLTAQQTLRASPHSTEIAFIATYLQETTALDRDLNRWSALQAAEVARHSNASIVGDIKHLYDDVALLQSSVTGPITRKYLQGTVESCIRTIRKRLDGIPAFHFEAPVYRRSLPMTRVSSDAASMASTSARIEDIDNHLASAFELISLLSQPDAMKTIADLIGPNEAAALRQKGTQLAGAERLRASLIADQRATESRVKDAQVRAAAEIEAKQNARQQELDRQQVAMAEKKSIAQRIINESLLITMLDEKFQLTEVIGYSMEATKHKTALFVLLRSKRSLIDRSVWQSVEEHYQQILPGLTLWQAGRLRRELSETRVAF
jgi:hypothetical protein